MRDLQLSDDFFENGGYSLAAIKLTNELSRVFRHEITLEVLFENSTIETLSTAIDNIIK